MPKPNRQTQSPPAEPPAPAPAPRAPTTQKCVHGKTLDVECGDCGSRYVGGPGVARVIRARRLGHNEYALVEETYFGRPASVRILKENCPRVPAEDRVRLYNEEWLGTNRFGDSGL